ncbi:MAG: hypothetical protein J7498_05505 [Sphingobium sp.]|nr:hypothetical protein [Sphingobium sp.]
MSILSALQSASVKLIGRRPLTFFGATEMFEMEICDFANEVAEDIAQYCDWQSLTQIHTITGDGTTAVFPLPDDYDRMLVRSEVQDTVNWAFGYRNYIDINAFLFDEARNFNPFPGGWIIYGNEMRFSPAPASGASATFPYISKNWASSASGSAKTAFDTDTDTFNLLDDKKANRLLMLGIVWRWNENKRLDATGDQEAFTKALDEYSSKDRGSRVIRLSSRRFLPGTYPAWPWPLG